MSVAAFKYKWFYNAAPTSNGQSKQQKHMSNVWNLLKVG